ncbi:MAG: tripartite tricarboxylate transporter substrate binding protein [Acetobacteraceae bacterium]|nr:tripartite tricarboxylate transporter substrate binding protein [Acetobacteraceae bacterium]
MNRRHLLAAAPLLAAPRLALAQEWRPSRPITFLVPFAAGSGTDIVARILGNLLSNELGQPVVVENRTGANGTIAAVAAARAAPDGHTLFVTTNTTHAANPHLLRRIEYDPVNDFTPISRLGQYIFWLLVGPEVPARNLREFLALARARPGQISYASGNGTGIVAGGAIAHAAGVEMLHVPYRSTPPALTDVVAGRVHSIVVDLSASMGFVRDGRLRPLGITSARRSALAPETPTLDEAGLTGFSMLSWAALFGPARLPPEILNTLSAALLRIGNGPEYAARMRDVSFEATVSTPDELRVFVAEQIASWGAMIRAARIEPE